MMVVLLRSTHIPSTRSCACCGQLTESVAVHNTALRPPRKSSKSDLAVQSQDGNPDSGQAVSQVPAGLRRRYVRQEVDNMGHYYCLEKDWTCTDLANEGFQVDIWCQDVATIQNNLNNNLLSSDLSFMEPPLSKQETQSLQHWWLAVHVKNLLYRKVRMLSYIHRVQGVCDEEQYWRYQLTHAARHWGGRNLQQFPETASESKSKLEPQFNLGRQNEQSPSGPQSQGQENTQPDNPQSSEEQMLPTSCPAVIFTTEDLSMADCIPATGWMNTWMHSH